jgi:Putative glutamine amidotransferase
MFEFLFKYPPAVFSRGTFVLLGSWPVWVLFLLILASAAALGWVFWRSRNSVAPSVKGKRTVILWLLQSAFLALVLLLLWQPALSVTALRPQQNIVAVLVDDSQSMAAKDGKDSRRDEAAKMLDGGLLRRLQNRFQVRLYRLGAHASRFANTSQLRAAEPATHIGAGLREIADEAGSLPIGSIVLLSDGSDNGGGIDLTTLAGLRARNLPVNAIGFGSENLRRDIELERAEVPDKTLVNSRLQARVSIHQNGFDGAKAKLTVSDGATVLASHDIVLKGGEQAETIEFNAGSSGPKTIYTSIESLPGEQNTQNNRLTRVIQVDGTTRRILYVEGEPRWEFKFLRRAVEDDAALHIVSILRTTQNKLYRQGIDNPNELADGFPSQPEDLFKFQGLILGSVETGFFTGSQQEIIKDFVDRRGGGLLFLGGRASLADGGYDREPFTQLLPVKLPRRTSTFRRDMAEAVLTPQGKQSLITRIEDDQQKSVEHWKILPYLSNYEDAGTPKPGAVVLAEMNAGGTRLPLLITENYGRGRTAVFATGGSWRWQMQQPVDDMSHEMFWRQLLRWVVAETPGNIDISLPSTLLTDAGEIRLSAEVRQPDYLPAANATVQARIEGPGGLSDLVTLRPEPLKQGVYSADWNATRPGAYVVDVTATQGNDELGHDVHTFRREDGVAENFHREQNRDLLEKLAAETHGHYFRTQDASRLVDEISYSDAGITARETKDLWNLPIVFIVVIALRAAEWVLRRRWSVV